MRVIPNKATSGRSRKASEAELKRIEERRAPRVRGRNIRDQPLCDTETERAFVSAATSFSRPFSGNEAIHASIADSSFASTSADVDGADSADAAGALGAAPPPCVAFHASIHRCASSMFSSNAASASGAGASASAAAGAACVAFQLSIHLCASSMFSSKRSSVAVAVAVDDDASAGVAFAAGGRAASCAALAAASAAASFSS
eukprot:234-Pelagococcus_subviridis.AAC.2